MNASSPSLLPAKHSVLPTAYLPQGLTLAQAAAMFGLSATTFQKLISDGLMPRGKKIYGCRRWDSDELIAAWKILPNEDSSSIDRSNPWSPAGMA